MLGSDYQQEKPLKEGENHFEPVKRLNDPIPNIHIDHRGPAAGAQGAERFESSYKYGNRMQIAPKKLGEPRTTSPSATNLQKSSHVADLRSTHFSLGSKDHQIEYISQAATSFTAMPITNASSKGRAE
jgi:hypothetical protein